MKKICILFAGLILLYNSHAQNYVLDFGTDTGTILCSTQYTGTQVYCSQNTVLHHPNTYSVNFISSNKYQQGPLPEKCQFELRNPGDPSVGSGSELQFIQDDFPDLRFQVGDFQTSGVFKISFKLKINKPSALHYSYPSIAFYFGSKKSQFLNKTKTIPFTSIPSDTAVFGSIYFRSDGTLPSYYNALDIMQGNTMVNVHVYPTAVSQMITQGVVHTVSVYANTSLDSVLYKSPQGLKTLSAQTYHVYIDSILKYVPMKNIYYRGGDISAFSWYVKSPNYFAPIIVDDIQWSTDFMISPLPVELSRFTASICQREHPSVCLSWRTELEINNEKFVVERSDDGVDFKSIGIVHGFGTTTTPHEYTFEDQSLLNGIYYYRLQQFDFDGASDYSPLQAVSVLSEYARCDVLASLRSDDQNYILYDMVGREVKSMRSKIDMNVVHGLYVYVVIDGNEILCREKIWIP